MLQNMYMIDSEQILAEFSSPQSIVSRSIKLSTTQATLLFNPNITDNLVLREVCEALEISKFEGKLTADSVIESIIFCAEVSKSNDIDKARVLLCSGDSLLIIDGLDEIIVITSRKWDKRSVSEPPLETVIRGPREGFIEDIKTNLSLIERRMRSPYFTEEKLIVGKQSATTVVICYMSNIASSKLVKKVKERIQKIDIDGIVDSSYILQLIEDRPRSIFRQIGTTEKPDILQAKMLEGRIGILVDGSPLALTLPFLIIEDLQNSDDYYGITAFSTMMRVIRLVGIIMAVLLPAMYVAIQVYHFDLIPVRFLVTLMSAVKGLPLPPLAEVVFVILIFEIIREAGVRMPRAVGMAMSIVGAVVLGDTAVKAGMISSPAVMVVALSSIALYTVPNLVRSMSILRLLFVVIGGVMGLYGIILGALLCTAYLVNMDSFGSPYLAPFAPLIFDDLKDGLLKVPVTGMTKRPYSIPTNNRTRKKSKGKGGQE